MTQPTILFGATNCSADGSGSSRIRLANSYTTECAGLAVVLSLAIPVGAISGAYASFEENLKSGIMAGKVADLAVLGRDRLREDPSKLVAIPVQRTMVGGK